MTSWKSLLVEEINIALMHSIHIHRALYAKYIFKQHGYILSPWCFDCLLLCNQPQQDVEAQVNKSTGVYESAVWL